MKLVFLLHYAKILSGRNPVNRETYKPNSNHSNPYPADIIGAAKKINPVPLILLKFQSNSKELRKQFFNIY